jgi:hypothetical protein
MSNVDRRLLPMSTFDKNRLLQPLPRRRSRRGFGHVLAFGGAPSAGFGGGAAVVVVVHLAFLRALNADVGAQLGYGRRDGGRPAGERAGSPADFGAVAAGAGALLEVFLDAQVGTMLAGLSAFDAGADARLMFNLRGH